MPSRATSGASIPVRGSSAAAAVAVGDEEAAVEVVAAGADARPGSWVSVGAVDCVAGAAEDDPLELDEPLDPLLEPLLFVEPPSGFVDPELPELVVEPLEGPNGSEYWSSPAPPWA